MSATGIGASVKRKEDIRFITGKGRYVDDINRPGQAYAYFLRSPHAHATHRQDRYGRRNEVALASSRSSPAHDTAADKIGAHIGGVTVHSKDGSPMKVGAFPALAHGKALYVGDPVAVIVADTYPQARDAAEKVVVDYGVLPAVVDTRAPHSRASPKFTTSPPATPSSTGISATRLRPMRRSPKPRTSRSSIWSTTGPFPTRWSRAPRSATMIREPTS